jgi:hypothetical protein
MFNTLSGLSNQTESDDDDNSNCKQNQGNCVLSLITVLLQNNLWELTEQRMPTIHLL